jgi:hypothetical protein
MSPSPFDPPEGLGRAAREVWWRIALLHDSPAAYIARCVAGYAGAVDDMDKAVAQAPTDGERLIFDEQRIDAVSRLQAAVDVFAELLWAEGAEDEREAAAELAEDLVQQFLAAGRADAQTETH